MLSLPKSPYTLKSLHLQSRIRQPSRPCRPYSSPSEIVSEPALFCKQRFLLLATRSWSGIVRVVDINSVSVELTVRCGFGSPVCGATGGQHCSLSNRRPLSPGIARGFDSIGPGKVATLKDDPRHPNEVRNLIRQMSLANPRRGAPRLHGELLKLGIPVSQATVAKYMVRQRKPPPKRGEPFSTITPRTSLLPISSSSQRLPSNSYSSS